MHNVGQHEIYLRAMRTFITLSMLGGVLSIAAGMMAKFLMPDACLLATFGVLCLFWSWGFVNLFMDAQWTEEPAYPGASCEASVFWIWFPALGSSINAVSIAAGAEEAPLNTAWWLSTAALIATSFLTTLAFLREIKWRPIDRVLNSYVFTSWIVAGFIVIAWWLCRNG